MQQIIAVTMVSLLLTGCSVFGVRSVYEQPAYEVVGQAGEAVELRRYGARLAAQSTVDNTAGGDDRDSAFMLLFDYISGANRTEASIAMTVPVETAQPAAEIAMTAPVETARSEDGAERMRFFLPAEYDLASAPKPLDPRVSIVVLPEQTVAVLRFSGLGREATLAAKKKELLAALEEIPWRAASEPVALFYDPPWTIPFLRRNEVSVRVEPAGQNG